MNAPRLDWKMKVFLESSWSYPALAADMTSKMNSSDWHTDDRLDLAEPHGQVVAARREYASGGQDLAGEGVAQDPEDLVADIRLAHERSSPTKQCEGQLRKPRAATGQV
jgi:hypothetical protein